MNIVICDDDREIYEKVQLCCTSVIGEPIVFFTYENGYDMLKMLSETCEADLFILDIEMPEIDGIQLRKKLEQTYVGCSVIYLTNHDEYMRDAFGRYVIGFVSKRELEAGLTDKLGQFYREWHENVRIYIKDAHMDIKRNDIISVRGERVYSVLTLACGADENGVLVTREICVRETLNSWE